MAAIAITPASGSITAKLTTCRVNVTGADTNRAPDDTGGTYEYYLLFSAPAGTDDGKSYKFNVSSDGKHEFNNYVFPDAGSWTIRLRDASNDSDVATAVVVVS